MLEIIPDAYLFEDKNTYHSEKLKKMKFSIYDSSHYHRPLFQRCSMADLDKWWFTSPYRAWKAARIEVQKQLIIKMES